MPRKSNVDMEKLTGSVKALIQESDRGCVITGAAYLDGLLEDKLRSLCRDDEESVRQVVDPLFESWTFSAKIQAAFAFRLISKELKKQLDLIRRIRNDFAHSTGPVSLQTPECQDRLRGLMDAVKAWVDEHQSSILTDIDGMAEGRSELKSRLTFALAISKIAFEIHLPGGAEL
jgi:hypothetical protein